MHASRRDSVPVARCLAFQDAKEFQSYFLGASSAILDDGEPMYLSFLVVCQFILSAVLVLTVDWWPFPISTALLCSPGGLLVAWALYEMGPTKTRIHPMPSESTQLVTTGPYRLVRHPMYSGLLWFTAALLISPPSLWRPLVWLLLLVVLVAKSRAEDLAMRRQFSDYRVYAAQVGGLIPKPFGHR